MEMSKVELRIPAGDIRYINSERSTWCRKILGPAFTVVDGRRQYHWQAKWLGWNLEDKATGFYGGRKRNVLCYAYYFRNPAHATLFKLKWA